MRAKRRGFSLLEAVIAMVIVGMISVYSLNAVSGGFDAAFRARRAIEMNALADQRLDYLDMLQPADYLSLPDSVANGIFDPPNNEYSWQMTSTPYTDQPGVFDVNIYINYRIGTGSTFKVHTYVYRRAAVNLVGSAGG